MASNQQQNAKEQNMRLINTLMAFGLTIVGFVQPAAAATEKDFVWYCESDEATPAQKVTVKEIYSLMNIEPNVSCRDVFKRLSEDNYLSFYFDESIVTDLSPLNGLNNIVNLHCEACDESAVASIPPIEKLRTLSLLGGHLETFPNIEKFKNLKNLVLSTNSISQVKMSNVLRNLERIEFEQTQIDDLSFLTELKRLKALDIVYPVKNTLQTLPMLPNLEKLNTSAIGTLDYSFLENAPNIIELRFIGNDVKDLRTVPLSKSLKRLTLIQNSISSISKGDLPKDLEHLDLSNNPIRNFNALTELKKLFSFSINYSDFKEWSALDPILPQLEELSLWSTLISENEINAGKTKEWPKLRKLIISETEITSLAFFKKIKSPKLEFATLPYIENKTEENCPTSGVPAPVAEFCKEK